MLLYGGKGRGREEYEHVSYEPEGRFRDRRGREHYDDGRYAPQGSGGSWIESHRDEDFPSRYGMPESRYDGYPEMHYGPTRPAYEQRQYPSTYRTQPMNKIGFAIGGEMERMPREFDKDFRADEMASRKGGAKQIGYSASSVLHPLDRKEAEEWVSHMRNTDGSIGQHWSFDQAKQLMTQKKIDCDPVQFYAALNAVYSDFYAVAKKHGVSNIEFFADLAKAWLDDQDAVPDKLSAYYAHVVEH